MNYKIITFLVFLLFSTFFNGLKSVFSKPYNFLRGALASYSESVSGRTGLNSSNVATTNENTHLLGVFPPSYSESVSGRTGLNTSNGVVVNESRHLSRGALPSYNESVSGRTGLNSSNGVVVNENTHVSRGAPPSYTESISEPERTAFKPGEVTVIGGLFVFTLISAVVMVAILTSGFGLIK